MRQKDATNIEKLKNNYFCYKPMTYKELLYNGQIKKEGETPSGEYTNDWGIIDTLGQHLYIKNDENCPLYEVKIDGDSIVKNNNEDTEKKIIGKLILNDGQPCYKSNEKLWKKFLEDEWADEHLECDVEIFGKKTDSRYINWGSVTYDEIYLQNLDSKYYQKLKDKVSNNKVALYSREFLGIDKKCDEESSITTEKINKLSYNQGRIKFLYLIEAIFNLFFSLGVFIVFMIWVCCSKKKEKYMEYVANNILLGELIVILGCLIAEAVYLSRIIKNDTSYQCSDDITNELFKKENDNTGKSILYSWINLGLDIFIIVGNAIAITIGILTDKKRDDESKSLKSTDKTSINNFFNSARKDFKSDDALNENVRDVVVNNNNYNNNNYNNNNYSNYNNYNSNYNYNNNNNYNTNYNSNNNYDSNYNNNNNNNNNYNNYNVNNNVYNNANNNANNNVNNN